MKKNYSPLICSILLTFGLFSSVSLKAQFLSVTNNSPNQCYTGSNQVICSVSSTVVGTTSYSWAYANYPCGAAPAISGTSPSVALNLPCAGNYSIGCYALNSSNAVIGVNFTNVFVSAASPPSITITGPSTVCLGNSLNMTASGANTYTWSNGTAFPSVVVNPLANTCYSVIGTNSLGCSAMAVHCVSITTASISISPPSPTVCQGSSVTFTASGAVTYSWNTVPVSTGPTLNIIPTPSYSGFTVTGVDANGCFGGNVVFITIDTTCANVWPGDANSDGVVNSSDVFEIGLAYNVTGTARSGGSNAYTSQFANAWTGYGSTGKNRCHIDCNGDGTINNNDTVAIYNNYSLTHSFKPSESSAVNPDISLVANSGVVNEGMWQKADIVLGSASNQMSNLYGVAFDIDFDNTLIQSNSAYIVYTSSFLNASNQNVQFRKTNFAAGKAYAASVRANGSNVSGNGKIGEFWFMVKSGVPANSVLNLGISNSSKVSNSGVHSSVSGGSTTLTVVRNLTGISENSLFNSVQLFPNPASNLVTLQSSVKAPVTYSICDIVGREIAKGEFTTSKTIDLSAFAKGTYLVRLENGSDVVYKKLILEK